MANSYADFVSLANQQPAGVGPAGPNGVQSAYGSNYASPGRYDYYNNLLKQFRSANPYTGPTDSGPTTSSGWGTNFSSGTSDNMAMATPNGNAQLDWNAGLRDKWLATLTPSQQAEWNQVANAHDSKTTSTLRGAGLAAIGGIAGGAALGAGALGGAAASGATGSVTAGPLTEVAAGGVTAGGAGDAGAGMGWMGGASGAGAGTMGDVAATTGASTSADFFGPGGAGTLANNAGGISTGSGNWLSSLMSSLGTGGSGGLTLGNIGSLVNTIGSVGGALYNSNKLAGLGKGTPAQQTANSQLNTLLQNPSSITSMPGYAAGLQAVERTGAAQGYLGSGNMMVGLDQYAGNFYNQTLQTLSGIGQQNAGVNAEYTIGGMQLFGQGMNSLGGYLAKFGGSLPDLFSSLGLG